MGEMADDYAERSLEILDEGADHQANHNICPECGHWKGADSELCRECAEEKREERNEMVSVPYVSRVGETDLAVSFKLEAGFMGKVVWIPKSLLLETRNDKVCRAFGVPRWFADNEGLEYSL